MNNLHYSSSSSSSSSSSLPRRFLFLSQRHFLLLFFSLLLLSCHVTTAQIPCLVTSDCQEKLPYSGDSECRDGICTNPFAQGCLRVMDKEKKKSNNGYYTNRDPFERRVCNSDDDDDDDRSNCRRQVGSSDDDDDHDDDHTASSAGGGNFQISYQEIRIAAGDWESSIFLGWIVQILLGELLQVPVTIETATPKSEGTVSFYDTMNSMVYPAVPYNYQALRRATELNGDCTKRSADLDDDASGTTTTDVCAHLLPEVWSGQINAYTAALDEGYVEPTEGNGMVGKFSFMIPKFAVIDDPTLTTWHGLQNRSKMANTFLRPTTWHEYCTEVSLDNCMTPNDVAQRAPHEFDGDEWNSYFVPDIYIGHFRATDKNNCTIHPDSCTGNVVAPPCDWDTLTESQMYWNNIALTSDGRIPPNSGYSYFEMIQVWNAANATRSPVFFWWWQPDSLDQLFATTDAEMQPVYLPAPTAECEKNRVTNEERCSEDEADRLGASPVGSCGTPAHSLQKVISTSLFTSTFAEPEATRSPAYEFIKRFRVSDLSLTIILRDWIHKQQDTYGIDPRIAVCEWVYDNLDDLTGKFIPPGYPRVFEQDISTPMFIAAFTTGILALAMAIFAVVGTIKYRNNLIFKYAHVPFVMWILVGLIMVCTGAILVSPQHPSDPLCIAQPYLITLGYTIELMPLVVKVSAVNHLIHQSKRMRRVNIDTNRLHMQVGGVAICVFIYLVVWTSLDAPRVVETAHLVEQGEPTVNVSTSCQSGGSHIWVMLTYIWQGFLLLSALILAIQSRNVKQEFNESQSLAFMVYSHTLFLILRALIYALPPENFPASNTQSASISLCLSLDSINTLIVYFGPKFYAIANHKDTRSAMSMNERSSIVGGTTVASAAAMAQKTSRSGFLGQSNFLRSRSTNSVEFEEPPPEEEEIEALMGKACDLLVAAALEHDRQAEQKQKQQEKESHSKRDPKEREDEASAGKKDEEVDAPRKEHFFMQKDQLLLLRSICTRIGKARFDFENASLTSTIDESSSRKQNESEQETTRAVGGGGPQKMVSFSLVDSIKFDSTSNRSSKPTLSQVVIEQPQQQQTNNDDDDDATKRRFGGTPSSGEEQAPVLPAMEESPEVSTATQKSTTTTDEEEGGGVIS